ncbi:hypothetical protein Tco_0922753 [Tanacetum coccineum]|uniref:Uncharacterized protein n=1 Tax=Tanacetum coccineum TaxID=301880 RepID=A0ABQ5D687_9ASTR
MVLSLSITNDLKKVVEDGDVMTEETETIELWPQKKGTKLSDFFLKLERYDVLVIWLDMSFIYAIGVNSGYD